MTPARAPQETPIYEVRLTAFAERLLRDNVARHGRKTVEQVQHAILDLAREPWAKTQPLGGSLAGYRSLHAGRIRAVVAIRDDVLIVICVDVGWHASGTHDDIYQLVTRMLARSRRKR